MAWRSGLLSIEDLVFDHSAQRVRDATDDRDLSDEIDWATFGQPVLRGGRIVQIDEIAGMFYDARHVLAFDSRREEGLRIGQRIYDDYPRSFEENMRAALRAGAPRARYFHNAVGLSSTDLIMVQREGTIEEIAAALRMRVPTRVSFSTTAGASHAGRGGSTITLAGSSRRPWTTGRRARLRSRFFCAVRSDRSCRAGASRTARIDRAPGSWSRAPG